MFQHNPEGAIRWFAVAKMCEYKKVFFLEIWAVKYFRLSINQTILVLQCMMVFCCPVYSFFFKAFSFPKISARYETKALNSLLSKIEIIYGHQQIPISRHTGLPTGPKKFTFWYITIVHVCGEVSLCCLSSMSTHNCLNSLSFEGRDIIQSTTIINNCFQQLVNIITVGCSCTILSVNYEMYCHHAWIVVFQNLGYSLMSPHHCRSTNTSSCSHFQQLNTLRMSHSSWNFAEILNSAYESYLVLNAWNRTLLAFKNLSQNHSYRPGVPKLSPSVCPFSISIDEHVPLNMGAGGIFSRKGPIVDFLGLRKNYFCRGG